MFENLKYNRIIVTGCQRSGTTICARIIAEDTGLEYIDERDYEVHNEAFFRKIMRRDNIVVQAPAMLHIIQEFTDALIVFVHRDIKEIEASQKRINWDIYKTVELIKYGYIKGDINKIKLDYWEKIKSRLNILEINYNDLRKHKLFIENRDKFGVRQWQL